MVLIFAALSVLISCVALVIALRRMFVVNKSMRETRRLLDSLDKETSMFSDQYKEGE